MWNLLDTPKKRVALSGLCVTGLAGQHHGRQHGYFLLWMDRRRALVETDHFVADVQAT
jgi:hypothetical protein